MNIKQAVDDARRKLGPLMKVLDPYVEGLGDIPSEHTQPRTLVRLLLNNPYSVVEKKQWEDPNNPMNNLIGRSV